MIVISNCTLIDGTGREPVYPATVVIDGEKISYAGPSSGFSAKCAGQAKDVELVDGSGKTVMPGMVDTHVHLGMGGQPGYMDLLVREPATLTALKALRRAQRTLAAGFTTIRSMGDKGAIDVVVKQAIEEGYWVGPRIVASGRCLTITGGHGDMFPEHVRVEAMGRIVDGVDEALKGAREQIKLGVDNVKLMATGGGMSPGPALVAQLNVDEMKAAVDEAHKYGKTTAAHAIATQGIKNAIIAGVDSIEHGTYMDEEAVELMVTHKVFLAATLAAFKTIKYGPEAGVPRYTIEKVKSFREPHIRSLRMCLQAGVKVTLGTDAGTPFNYHGDNAYELECLVENGLTPAKAIEAATRVGAEALHLEDQIGTVEAGKLADIIVIDGNPLQDIRVLQDKSKISLVLKSGRIVARHGHLVVDQEDVNGVLPM
ncbi:MAG TPA: amidohydrolase family protein [Firmicutes bacterium]|nr:amidohydrolase family protein [Bacillota bacterium]